MREKPLHSLFPHLYHLSGKKKKKKKRKDQWPLSCLPLIVLPWLWVIIKRCLTGRLEVVRLLSTISNQVAHSGRRDSRSWFPRPSAGFSNGSFCRVFVPLHPRREPLHFPLFERLKFLSKFFLFFPCPVLHERVNAQESRSYLEAFLHNVAP